MHRHLDVTFREDANTTIDKIAAQNQNIIRKWSLSILKTAEVSRHKPVSYTHLEKMRNLHRKT